MCSLTPYNYIPSPPESAHVEKKLAQSVEGLINAEAQFVSAIEDWKKITPTVLDDLNNEIAAKQREIDMLNDKLQRETLRFKLAFDKETEKYKYASAIHTLLMVGEEPIKTSELVELRYRARQQPNSDANETGCNSSN